MGAPKPPEAPPSDAPRLEVFRAAFDAAFRGAAEENLFYEKPYVDLDLELCYEVLAGPLWSIREQGECDYVFRNDPRFPGVDSPSAFKAWCMDSVKWYRSRILSLPPTSEQSEREQALLLELGERYEKVIDLACAILERRFEAAKTRPAQG